MASIRIHVEKSDFFFLSRNRKVLDSFQFSIGFSLSLKCHLAYRPFTVDDTLRSRINVINDYEIRLVNGARLTVIGRREYFMAKISFGNRGGGQTVKAFKSFFVPPVAVIRHSNWCDVFLKSTMNFFPSPAHSVGNRFSTGGRAVGTTTFFLILSHALIIF